MRGAQDDKQINKIAMGMERGGGQRGDCDFKKEQRGEASLREKGLDRESAGGDDKLDAGTRGQLQAGENKLKKKIPVSESTPTLEELEGDEGSGICVSQWIPRWLQTQDSQNLTP